MNRRGLTASGAKELFEKFKMDLGKMKDQMMEVAAVAVMVGGGPAYTHVPVMMDTLEALGA